MGKMKFIKTKPYLRAAKKIGITAQDETRLFDELNQTPEKGDLIIGGGGICKIRLALGNRGKSAGARVIYTFLQVDKRVILLFVYVKAAQSNLTQEQIKQLRLLNDIFKGA